MQVDPQVHLGGRLAQAALGPVHAVGRQYAAEQGIAEEEALAKCMEKKSREFVEAGAEVYQQA